MLTPLVSIIIPVFNQWRFTEECLEALVRHSSPDIPTEVVVVDNASTDETASGLRAWRDRWSALKVESLSRNTGFSPACNHGAHVSSGEYLLFLNNDTAPQAGWLESLLDELRQPGVGLVGPKLVYPGGKSINHAGYVFGLGSFYGIYHEHDSDAPEVNKKRDYQALLGACISSLKSTNSPSIDSRISIFALR
jgi:GT2 family glycosyltransferase